MWIIFREPTSPYNHIDRVVVDIVEDSDIAAYQSHLATTVGGRVHEILDYVYFLQNFFSSEKGIDYFARKYKPCQVTSLSA